MTHSEPLIRQAVRSRARVVEGRDRPLALPNNVK